MMTTNKKFTRQMLASAVLTLVTMGICDLAAAATITWKGQVWDVTGAEPIGAPSSGQINGNASNVFVDANGYLHVRISKNGGSTFTGAQLFTQKNLGFGTYQFQIEGDLANMDKGVVLGLFPYGPTAGIGVDGENEIDIEFSKWNDTGSGNNADFTYYPPTGFGTSDYQASFEHNFFVNFEGATLSTSRIEWTSTTINSTIMTGFQPIGTTANVISPNDFYQPSNPKTKIPQVALPLGINLWTYGSKPTRELDIIIHDFTFVPLCTSNCSSSSSSKSSVAPSSKSSISSVAPSSKSSSVSSVAPSSKSSSSSRSSVGQTSTSSSSTSSNIGGGTKNIAPEGTAYVWSKNSTATSNSNRASKAGINDGNLTSSVIFNSSGENGAAKWEGAGVVWSNARTVSSIKFFNGADDGYGNGYFQSGIKAEYTTDGVTWIDLSWAPSPAYPYSSSAYGKSYSFAGNILNGVRGVRVVGQTGSSSWSGAAMELQVFGQ